MPTASSRLTINTTFESQPCDHPNCNVKSRRLLSSIASSSDEPTRSQGLLNKLRESKSLDPLPVVKVKQTNLPQLFLKVPGRSTKSLDIETCDKCLLSPQPFNDIVHQMVNNNSCPNGNIVRVSREDCASLEEDAEAPLLHSNPNPTIVHRRKVGNGTDDGGNAEDKAMKRWRSLESVPVNCDDPPSESQSRKIINNSIRSWIAGIFNGNGLRASNTSLRKGVLSTGYNDLHPEKESIV